MARPAKYAAIKHLRAGTISAAEKRWLLQVCKTKYYALINAASVVG